jgi:hypothetical protein
VEEYPDALLVLLLFLVPALRPWRRQIGSVEVIKLRSLWYLSIITTRASLHDLLSLAVALALARSFRLPFVIQRRYPLGV